MGKPPPTAVLVDTDGAGAIPELQNSHNRRSRSVDNFGTTSIASAGFSPMMLFLTSDKKAEALDVAVLDRLAPKMLAPRETMPSSPKGKAASIDVDLPERRLGAAINRLWMRDKDAQTAIFLGALACEVKIKQGSNWALTPR